MAEVTHEEAVKALYPIFVDMDAGQREQLAILRGPDASYEYLRCTLLSAWRVWHIARASFSALIAVDFVDPFQYNVWLVSTGGIRENIRSVLREAREMERVLNEEYVGTIPVLVSAGVPAGFAPGRRLAEGLGFRGAGVRMTRALR